MNISYLEGKCSLSFKLSIAFTALRIPFAFSHVATAVVHPKLYRSQFKQFCPLLGNKKTKANIVISSMWI